MQRCGRMTEKVRPTKSCSHVERLPHHPEPRLTVSAFRCNARLISPNQLCSRFPYPVVLHTATK